MLAGWYEKNGPAPEVLRVTDRPTPEPGPGEVRVHLVASAVNPSVVDVDFGDNLPVTAQVLRPHGVVTSYSSMRAPTPAFPYYALHGLNPVVRPVLVYSMPDSAKIQAQADIARWVAESQPIFTIAARYPLERIVDAHLAVERGEKIGHVLLDIPQ